MMKVVFDFHTKLEDLDKVFRLDLYQALEKERLSLSKFTTTKLAKTLNQQVKPDCFISFDLQHSKAKLRATKYFVLSENAELSRRIATKLMNFDKLIVKTNFKKLQLANKFGIEKERIIVVHEKINQRFDSENITEDERDIRRTLTVYRVNKPYLFFYSRLDDVSNVQILVEAFSKIHQKFPDCKLLLASPEIKVGWDNKPVAMSKKAKQVIELVAQYKLQRKIVFAGTIDDKHLPVVIRNAEVCINLKDYNHFPHSLVEQIFSGACILSADNTIAKEILGNAGFVVSAKHLDSITQGLKYLLEEEAERVSLRGKAAKRKKMYMGEALYGELFTDLKKSVSKKSKESVLFLKYGGKVDFEKIVKTKLEPETFDLKKKYSLFQIVKEFRKYRLVFLQGRVPKSWLVRLFVLKGFFRGTKLIFVEVLDFDQKKSDEKIYEKLLMGIKKIIYVFLVNAVSSAQVEFDHKYSKQLKVLPLFVDLGNQEKETKLGAYIGIVLEYDFSFGDLTYILEKTYHNKCKFVINSKFLKNANLENLEEKYRKRMIEAGSGNSLAATKIYVNSNPKISQSEILQAFESGNICICLKTPNTINLIKDGINGYLFEKIDTDKLVKQINVLLENKKHQKDICNINFEKSKQFSFENLKSEYEIFLASL